MSKPDIQTDLVQPDSLRVKIVADDAAKAVNAIKEKFGESAKVVSVKQEESSGLTGFLKKPRLEIIVEVPKSVEGRSVKVETEKSDLGSPRKEAKKQATPLDDNEQIDSESNRPGKPISERHTSDKEKGSGDGYFSNIDRRSPASEGPRLGSAANPIRSGTKEYVERAVSMLRSVGFDDSMIERIRYELDFQRMGETPTMEIYSRICDWLRSQFPESKPELMSNCRAFVGASGVGKTTAMSKMLSADVFVHDLEPMVLKIDGAVANPSDGLEAFCEIMGAPLFRSFDEIENYSEQRPVYVDMPGMNVNDPAAVESCRQTLDEICAEERVLVVNAAYETELIAETMLTGTSLGVTHVVFTHLDETRKAGKLWKYALNSGARPLFFSYGPNPAGDYTMDPFSFLLEKTFPQGRSLASARRLAPTRNAVVAPNREEMATA